MSNNEIKLAFVKSIHKWLTRTLEDNGNGEYVDSFVQDGSSIFCQLPTNFFDAYTIPEGVKIEMKFILKKS